MKENLSQVVFSPEKQELISLEKTGKYVFHGSSADVEALVPNQAIDVNTGPDRAPAVFATPSVDMAIFAGIMRGSNYSKPVSHVLEFGADSHDDGTYDLKFSVTREAWDYLLDTATGWVYVFNKEDFQPINGRPAEFESNKPVKPFKKIMVHKVDLPKNIEIRD